MSQQVSSASIQQPEKLKKKFCFASILFLVVTGIRSIFAFWGIRNFFSDIRFLSRTGEMTAIRYLLIDFADILFFIAALFITVLLFAKKNNFLLGIPMIMFSADALLQITFPFLNLKALYINYIFYIILFLSKFLSFLAVAIYIFIITAKKKPVSKAFCLIPIAVFSLFFIPYVFMPREIILLISDICFYFGVIFLLIWVTSPYKKNKAAKTAEVQPAPAVAPVMPKPVAAPVQPTAKPVENGHTKPLFGTVDMSANVAEEVTVDPVMRQFTSPVQPVSKTAEEDPERTVDYSYAEKFYPPVNMPAEKPETAPQPTKTPDFNAEVDKQQTVIKLLTDYKKLLDSGVISQEDYEKKKNELLGL